MSKLNMKKYSVDKYLKRGYGIGINDYKPVHRKPIVKLDAKFNLIEFYDSTEKALRKNRIGKENLKRVINGELESYKGFKYMYEEDYNRFTTD